MDGIPQQSLLEVVIRKENGNAKNVLNHGSQLLKVELLVKVGVQYALPLDSTLKNMLGFI